MNTRAWLALFASGVFFGGARSHYGLQLTPVRTCICVARLT